MCKLTAILVSFMNKDLKGKELLFATFEGTNGENVPWIPFAGVHAGKLKDYIASEILQDGEKLLECLLAVNKLYDPDGQPILFDLQVEAEILGCKLRWADKAPPSIESHPLANSMEIPYHIITENDGRLPMILNVMRRFKEKVGKRTGLFGLITGPLTLASHLRGTKIFMDLIKQKEFATSLFTYCVEMAKIWPTFI